MNLFTRRLLLLAVFIFIAMPLLVVSACGPFFEADTFIPPHRPKVPARFLRGQLGILQPRYRFAEKVAAFRYLNGGTLNEEERKQWEQTNPTPIDWEHLTPAQYQQRQKEEEAAQQNTGPARWASARAQYPGAPPAPPQRNIYEQGSGKPGWGEASNCTDAAYDTAIVTLNDRAGRWGRESASLHDWLNAQDAVFANCNGDAPLPASVDASAPTLLKQDRAYQTAAALLYTEHLDEAATAFTAIAHDSASPWAKWGDYLAARCIIRKAAKTAPASKTELANFDPALLEQATQRLQQVLRESTDPQIKHAAQGKLDFIAIRLYPQKRSQELAAILAGPHHDPEFAQHMIDLQFLLEYKQGGDAPLIQWTTLTGSTFGEYVYDANRPPDPKTAALSLATWRNHPELPWLVAALQNALTPDAALLAAAAKVPENSPAYLTTQFHRIRLLEQNNPSEARTLSTALLSVGEQQKDLAAINAIHAVRMQTATSLDDLLIDAPRLLVEESESQAGLNAKCNSEGQRMKDCKAAIPAAQFDADTAIIFNTQLPLELWIAATQNNTLPPHLRRSIVRAAWLRAALLMDKDAMAKLTPMLPNDLRESATGGDDSFRAALTVLRAPGLKPFLEQGVQRSVSYSSIDNFRYNFWCSNEVKSATDEKNSAPIRMIHPSFLTREQTATATKQVAALNTESNGIIWAGKRVMEYTRAHPNEKYAAEALALTVRATRYPCYDQSQEKEITALSKEAFTLLHANYPKSTWAEKTKYYY